MTKQNCGTCAHAKFERTPTGRPKKDAASRCGFKVALPPLPFCATVNMSLHWVRATDGENCKTWAAACP